MICTCDNCHYTFEADALPTWCSNCGKEARNHKFASKIISVPCVRIATEDEASWYEKAISDERDATDLAEKIRMLGEPFFRKEYEEEETEEETEEDETEETSGIFGVSYPADPYGLSVHEHNFALMLIYYIKQLGYFGKQDLEKMIMSDDVDEKAELYKNVKKTFNRGINTEERQVEKPSRLTREVWEAATPALKVLYSFRQDDDFKMWMGDVPNRGNIKRIDVQKLAAEPSEGFVRFLTELYNGLSKSRGE